MAATYQLDIGASSDVAMQPGWTHDATANGRDTLVCDINSVDASYRPALDAVVVLSEKVVVLTSSVANPTVITTAEAHGIVSGQTVVIAGHAGSTPAIDGSRVATRISATTFSIPVNVTVAGTGGTVARRIFGGTILKPSERGWAGLGTVPITTHVEAVDYNADAEHRYLNEVLLAGTLKSMLTTICTRLSWTLHTAQVDGPALSDLPCEWASAQAILDQLSILTGYVWEKDELNRLRMYLPGTDAAPIDVTTANQMADGDVTVEPTRENYANRIILLFTEAAQQAYAYFVATANPTNGETVLLGSQTYTFEDALTNVAGHVHIGGSALETMQNLAAAVVLGAGSGTAYAAATAVNSAATAYARFREDAEIVAEAITAGAAGNAIAVGDTCAAASWITEGGGGTATLLFGSDEALTNVAHAPDPATEPTAEQTAHGVWELLVQSPETTSQAAADTLAAAVLAAHLPVPQIVTYDTYALGLKPGQTQTITIAERDINGTFLITEVRTRNIKGNLVLRTVTAIESLVLQSAAQWRDTYRQWSGSVSGSAVSVSGGGGTGGGGGVAAVPIYWFGGSGVESQPAPAAAAFVAANSVQVRIDSAVRGSTIGTCYVRLRASSGSVTARLRDVTNGATVGTSAAITNTAFTAMSFGVSLTAGVAYYAIELSGSVENAELGLGSGYLE